MEFTLVFGKLFLAALSLAAPLLLSLALVISLLGLLVGRFESWRPFEPIYWAFITATTVGYGDYRPARSVPRAISILIAICGMILTGIIVALAIHSANLAFEQRQHSTLSSSQVEQRSLMPADKLQD